jgi:hypothetical protein
VSLLYQGYYYTIAKSKNGSEPSQDGPLPIGKSRDNRALRRLYSKLSNELENGPKYEGPPPRPLALRMISSATQYGRTFKTYLPTDFLQTAYWNSALRWFSEVHDVGRGIIDPDDAQERFGDRCLVAKRPLYVSQVGFFVFIFDDENGQMKLWSMSYID